VKRKPIVGSMGSVEESAGEAVRHLREHRAGVGIEALGKSLICHDRHRIQLSAACGKAVIRAPIPLKAVLLFVVIGRNQIDIRPDGAGR